MPCKQNEYLLSRNIYVDLFRRTSEIVFLTHVHTDHLSGFLTHVNRVIIYCTHDTAKLLSIKYDNVSEDMFQILSYDTPVQVLDNLYVEIFPSFHCAGSCMFYFYNTDKSWSCFYTGDFRMLFTPQQLMKLPQQVDTLYIDDSYRHFEYSYPTFEQLLQTQWIPLLTEIQKFKNQRRIERPNTYMNANVLGIERLLINLFLVSNGQICFRFHRDMTLQRTKEIKWICQDYKDMFVEIEFTTDSKNSNRFQIILTDRKITNDVQNKILNSEIDDSFLICPGMYHFTKNGQLKIQNSTHHTQIKHVFFATHANQEEINELQRRISSNQTIFCNDQIL